MKVKKIPINKRFLILCEDKKSSKQYFESFKTDPKLRRQLSTVEIEVIHPRDFSPVGLVKKGKEKIQEARQNRNPYDEVWVVFDRDGHANVAQAFHDVAISKPTINVALSVRCFEYWVLLHFEKTTKSFEKCDEILSHINKNKYFEKGYEKSRNCYAELIDKVETAIKNAKWVAKQNESELERGAKVYDLNAHTNVHELVEKILNL